MKPKSIMHSVKLPAGLLAMIAIFGLSIQATRAAAYFLDMGGGVRPTGMGEAFVAVADDVNTMLYNPAGLSRLDRLEVTGMYSSLYSNLNMRLYNQAPDYMGYNLLAAVVPVKDLQGGLGVAWKHFSTVFYQENTLQLGYGRRIWSAGVENDGMAIDAGGNFKYLQWQVDSNTYTQDTALYPELQKHGFSVDAGLMVRLHPRFRIGLSAENLVPANVGLTTVENVPQVYRLGAAYLLPLESAILNVCITTLEIDNRNHAYNYKAGAESWWFQRVIGLRAGVNTDNLSCGLSCRYAWDPAMPALQLDYAFTYPWQIEDSAGSHWVGMTIGWDILNPREAEKSQERARKMQSALRAKTIALEAAKASTQALAEAQQAAKADGAQSLGKVMAAAAKINDAAETASLAAEVAQTAATDAKSTTISAIAAEAGAASSTAAADALQIQTLIQEVRALALLTPAVEPTSAVSPLPEKYSDRIVVGIETKVVTDFGSFHDLDPAIRNLTAGLQKTVGLKLEWRLLSPAELLLALHQGELDGVVAYEADLGKYQGPGRLEPSLTVRKNGRTEQSCCLLVRAGSPVTTLAQAKGKRLGYSSGSVAGRLDQLFFNAQDVSSARYFKSMEKQKNARDSLWALQMEAVDVVAEYGYILDIAKSIPEMNIRVIAESVPAPNSPLWLRSSCYPAKNLALQKLATALHEIHKDPAAASLLQIFQVERLVVVHEQK